MTLSKHVTSGCYRFLTEKTASLELPTLGCAQRKKYLRSRKLELKEAASWLFERRGRVEFRNHRIQPVAREEFEHNATAC